MITNDLTFLEQRGTLSYITPDLKVETLVGTFRVRHLDVNGRKTKFVVIARRKGGRNSWQLCDDRDVATFVKGLGWAS